MVGLFLLIIFITAACPVTATAAQQRLLLQFEPPLKEAYIGQETYFQIRLLDRIGLKEIGLVPVEWPNADIFLHQKIQNLSAVHDGILYDLNEWRFSLVAKSAGTMTFPPLCFVADAPTLISDRDLPNTVKILSSSQVQICAPPFSIDVLPLPAHSPPLFAATSVQLFDGVVPKASSIPVGTPIKRSLLLAAKGTLPVFLPDFQMGKINQTRIYNGKTERSMPASKDSLSAALRQTVVFIPQQPGELVLPEIKVFWLNTQTNQIETSVIPAYTLTVLPDQKTVSKTKTALKEALPSEREKPDTPEKKGHFENKVFLAVMAFLCVLCVIFLFKFFEKRRIRYRLVKSVEKACLNGEPDQISDAILAWASAVFFQHTFRSLADVRSLFEGRSDIFVQRLAELEMFLYGTGRFARHVPMAKESLGKNVLNAFLQAEQIKISKPWAKKAMLPDLYPTDDHFSS